MKNQLGSELCGTAQRSALAQFVHRYTGNHRPAWTQGKSYPVQFKDDADWLANTRFAVNKNGDLSARTNYCESTPTWPNNPELRIGHTQFLGV